MTPWLVALTLGALLGGLSTPAHAHTATLRWDYDLTPPHVHTGFLLRHCVRTEGQCTMADLRLLGATVLQTSVQIPPGKTKCYEVHAVREAKRAKRSNRVCQLGK